MAFDPPSSAYPGTILGLASRYTAGPGTHIHNGEIIASLDGQVVITPAPSSSTPSILPKRLTRIAVDQPSGAPPTISVTRPGKPLEVLPQVGNTVLCRVVRLTPRQAIVAIHQVDDTPLRAEWQGVIRTQDVRATEKDRVRIPESFRPGDIVVARVISLGDQANYYLTTASNELGVIMAKSKDGNDMVPMSWKEFWDPVTNATELRKAAKPQSI